MKLHVTMKEAINKQINAELYSAYLYLSMATYFDGKNLSGCSNWMKKQAQEEIAHAMKFYEYLYTKSDTVELDMIAKPPASWKSPIQIFESALKHEQHVTSLIHNLVDLAESLKDKSTMSFLQWFVDEQVEEEQSAQVVVDKLTMIGNDGVSLMMLDKELGERK